MAAIKTVACLVNRASPLFMDFSMLAMTRRRAALSQLARVVGREEVVGGKGEEGQRGNQVAAVLGSFAFATKLPTIFIHFTEFAYASLAHSPACQTAYFAYVGNPGNDSA